MGKQIQKGEIQIGNINGEGTHGRKKHGKEKYEEEIYGKERVIHNIRKKDKYRKKTNTTKKLYRKEILQEEN